MATVSLQITNRKPHPAGQACMFVHPPEVAETATKRSPAPLQKHSLDGGTIDRAHSIQHLHGMLPSNGHRRGTYRFIVTGVIPYLHSS